MDDHFPLNYSINSVENGLVSINFKVPESFATSLPMLFTSLLHMSRSLSYRSRHAGAATRYHSPEAVADREQKRLEFHTAVLKVFDKHRAAGLKTRYAVRETKIHFAARDKHLAEETIQSICRENGRLRQYSRRKI